MSTLRKLSLVSALFLPLATMAPAAADTVVNGIYLNGIYLNGIYLNGIHLDGTGLPSGSETADGTLDIHAVTIVSVSLPGEN